MSGLGRWLLLLVSIVSGLDTEIVAVTEMANLHLEYGTINQTAFELAQLQVGKKCFRINHSCWIDAQCCSARCQSSIRKCRPIR